MDALGTKHWNTAILTRHCVNNFAWVTDALREALTQLDDYNAETRETSRWAEWHSALAAAQAVKWQQRNNPGAGPIPAPTKTNEHNEHECTTHA